MLGGMKQSYGGLQIEEVETRQGAGWGKRIKKKCDIEQNGVCVAQLLSAVLLHILAQSALYDP